MAQTANPLSAAAFLALISVETLTGQFVEELEKCERNFSEPSVHPEGFWYLAALDDDMPEDLRASRAARRADRPPGFDPYWRWLDDYHRIRARWRMSLRTANFAVVAAIVETDLATTPPLERTSAKILRLIQSLHLTVPDPIWFGDYPPVGRGCAAVLRAKLAEVSVWVDELRILRDQTVRPTRTAADDGNAKELAKEAAKRRRRMDRLVGPGSDGLLILQCLAKVAIKDRPDALKARAIVETLLKREWKRGDKNLFIDLAQEGYLRSAPRAGGGYWISEDGVALAMRSLK